MVGYTGNRHIGHQLNMWPAKAPFNECGEKLFVVFGVGPSLHSTAFKLIIYDPDRNRDFRTQGTEKISLMYMYERYIHT